MYKLKESSLSEDQIEADVASFLGYVTPQWSSRFRLIAVNEQTSGADKLFNRFLPLYLQFKVSEGLVPLSRKPIFPSPFPLQKIRLYRLNNHLHGDPILYFKLREKAKTAIDFQHNQLLKFHKPPHQHAFYVAPLTTTMDEYNSMLNISVIERLAVVDPFEHRLVRIFNNGTNQSVGLIPFLRGHISIPPTVSVSTANHHYSFSKNGTDICWHSDGNRIMGDFRLSTQLASIYRSFYNGDVSITREQLLETIKDFFKENQMELDPEEALENTITRFALELKEKYSISLFLLGRAE